VSSLRLLIRREWTAPPGRPRSAGCPRIASEVVAASRNPGMQ